VNCGHQQAGCLVIIPRRPAATGTDYRQEQRRMGHALCSAAAAAGGSQQWYVRHIDNE